MLPMSLVCSTFRILCSSNFQILWLELVLESKLEVVVRNRYELAKMVTQNNITRTNMLDDRNTRNKPGWHTKE
jgi:hypothetical protein